MRLKNRNFSDKMMSKVTCILLLTIFALGATGEQCSVDEVKDCYTRLLYFGKLSKAPNGEDKLDLEKSCKILEESQRCMDNYLDACTGYENCSVECEEMIFNTQNILFNNTSFKEYADACTAISASSPRTTMKSYVGECNLKNFTACYHALVEYEGEKFPFYGRNLEELTETCSDVESKYECLDEYTHACNDHKDCNEDCKVMIQYEKTSELQNLFQKLCFDDHQMTAEYLAGSECFRENRGLYEECHKLSQKSLESMSELKGEYVEIVKANCCYFSWFEDCYVNITKKKCSEQATSFVTSALTYLIGAGGKNNCTLDGIRCSSPPLAHVSDHAVMNAYSNWLLLGIVMICMCMF